MNVIEAYRRIRPQMRSLWEYIAIYGIWGFASLAHAQGSSNTAISVEGVLDNVKNTLNYLIPFLALIATVMLLYGITRYVASGDDESKLQDARKLIVYGIIGLAVIVTLWALVAVVLDFFFGDATFNIPGAGRVKTL